MIWRVLLFEAICHDLVAEIENDKAAGRPPASRDSDWLLVH